MLSTLYKSFFFQLSLDSELVNIKTRILHLI
jgi:hypothetical protein